MNEREAIAILLASYRKDTKFSNPVSFAESARFLVHRYGSSEAVAKKLDFGRETVRALAKVAEMPDQVKELISEHKLLLTVAFDLIPFDPSTQVKLATKVMGLPFSDARAVIRYVRDHRGLSLSASKDNALTRLDEREMNVAVIRLPMSIHKRIIHGDPERTVISLIDKWVREGNPRIQTPRKDQDTLRLMIRLPRKSYRELRTRTKNVASLVEQIICYYLDDTGERKRRLTLPRKVT